MTSTPRQDLFHPQKEADNVKVEAGLTAIEKRFKDRIKVLKETSRERRTAEIIELPLWRDGKCGSPNSFLRSALFAAIQGKDRVLLHKAVLFSQQGLQVSYSGQQLNQEDMTIWLTLTDLAREYPLGTECCFTAYSILKHMGLKDGGEQRKVLYNSIHRLTACGVEIKANRMTYCGSLVDKFVVDEATGHYRVTLNKDLIDLFGDNDWTAISWQQRIQLRSKPLAQKMHEYFSSHQHPLPVTIEFFYDLTGSKNKDKYSFKRQVKAALEGLVKIGFLTSYKVEGNKVEVDRKAQPLLKD